MGLPQCLSTGISGRLGEEEEVVTVERVDVGAFGGRILGCRFVGIRTGIVLAGGGSSTHQPGDKWGIYLEADRDQNSWGHATGGGHSESLARGPHLTSW